MNFLTNYMKYKNFANKKNVERIAEFIDDLKIHVEFEHYEFNGVKPTIELVEK